MFKFTDGILWERFGWEVRLDEVISCRDEPCPHAYGRREKVINLTGGETMIEVEWSVPRVVVAYNEGRHNSTGICLDCLLNGVQANRGMFRANCDTRWVIGYSD